MKAGPGFSNQVIYVRVRLGTPVQHDDPLKVYKLTLTVWFLCYAFNHYNQSLSSGSGSTWNFIV